MTTAADTGADGLCVPEIRTPDGVQISGCPNSCSRKAFARRLKLGACAWQFGRMYFHAHHLLDVSVGAAVGATVTTALHAALGRETFTWGHFIAAQVCIDTL